MKIYILVYVNAINGDSETVKDAFGHYITYSSKETAEQAADIRRNIYNKILVVRLHDENRGI